MSYTKPTTWIGILLIVSIVSVSLMNFYVDLASRPDITLGSDSKDYISSFSSKYATSLSNLTGDNSGKKDTLIIGTESGEGEQIVQNELGILNFAQSKLTAIWNFFETIYNIPTFILTSLNLPISEFKNIINVISYVLVISLVIMGIKLARGS